MTLNSRVARTLADLPLSATDLALALVRNTPPGHTGTHIAALVALRGRNAIVDEQSAAYRAAVQWATCDLADKDTPADVSNAMRHSYRRSADWVAALEFRDALARITLQALDQSGDGV